jgi:hypothetical protein
VDWSWIAWLASVAAVVVSGAIARSEGVWVRRAGLPMGFANHAGMWGDLLLLPLANAAVVPHLTVGVWIVAAVVFGAAASAWLHAHWYRGGGGDHMWPAHADSPWWSALSWSGWAHVVYVCGELALLSGFVFHSMPANVVLFVTAVLTIHVPIGLLQPRYFRTGQIATLREQRLLLPALAALWAIAVAKL